MITLKYSSADLVKAIEVIRDPDSMLMFYKEGQPKKTFPVKKIQAFLFSKKVSQILSLDSATESIGITTSAENSVLTTFFDNLKNDFIAFDDENIETVCNLVDELCIEGARDAIEAHYLSQLFEKTKIKDKTTKQLYEMVINNIQAIDRNKINELPRFIREKIFLSKPKYSNEDDYAKVLIENKMKPYIFEQVRFELLSKETMKLVLNYVKAEPSLVDNFVKRIKCDLEAPPVIKTVVRTVTPKEKIKVLHIHPDSGGYFNCNFFEELNKSNELCSISCTSVRKSIAFDALLKFPQWMDPFDVVLVGGCDSNIGITKEFIEKSLNTYRNRGGILLLLHDAIQNGNYDCWTSDFHILETKGKVSRYPHFVSAKFKNSSSEIRMKPFEVSPTFSVAETHESFCPDPKYAVIDFVGDPNRFYYVENAKERFAHIQAGHSGKITSDEQKVLYNAIYHLFMSAKK